MTETTLRAELQNSVLLEEHGMRYRLSSHVILLTFWEFCKQCVLYYTLGNGHGFPPYSPPLIKFEWCEVDIDKALLIAINLLHWGLMFALQTTISFLGQNPRERGYPDNYTTPKSHHEHPAWTDSIWEFKGDYQWGLNSIEGVWEGRPSKGFYNRKIKIL